MKKDLRHYYLYYIKRSASYRAAYHVYLAFPLLAEEIQKIKKELNNKTRITTNEK